MAAQDLYSAHSGSAIGAARKLRVVVPHDTNELEFVSNGILCATGGVAVIVAVDDNVAVSLPVVAGQIYPIRVKSIRASGTTATGIVALIS